MEEINGQWIMHGIDWNEEGCLHSCDELVEYIINENKDNNEENLDEKVQKNIFNKTYDEFKYSCKIPMLYVVNSLIQDTIDELNLLTSTIEHSHHIIKMFIGRDNLFSTKIDCNDISHVVLVEGYNLKHFASVNVKQLYKD